MKSLLGLTQRLTSKHTIYHSSFTRILIIGCRLEYIPNQVSEHWTGVLSICASDDVSRATSLGIPVRSLRSRLPLLNLLVYVSALGYWYR